MSRADTPPRWARLFPGLHKASENKRADVEAEDTSELPELGAPDRAGNDSAEHEPGEQDHAPGEPEPAAHEPAERPQAEGTPTAHEATGNTGNGAEPHTGEALARWGWLRDLAAEVALAGTTPHVPAPTTTTYGKPSGLPSPARQREMRRRARHGQARHGLLGRSFFDRAPRPERRARQRAVDRAALAGPRITARGVAPVVARGVARVPRPGESPPPETVRPEPRPLVRQRLPLGPMAAIVLLVGVFATGLGLHHLTGAQLLPPGLFNAEQRRQGGAAEVLPPSPPTKIVIPALELHASVHTVGLTADGEIEVPAMERHHEAGWFNRSPTPGELGPSIIVGHVDSRSGPSVFHGLKKLRRGDTIEITRQDGSEAVFVVDSVERFNKRALPNDRVYGDYSSPNLRLITCGGQWVGGNTGYADNVIVFASLLSTSYPR